MKLFARYQHPAGYVIAHCGHPTANYPYALYGPDGDMILAPNGRAWPNLLDAGYEVQRRLRAAAGYPPGWPTCPSCDDFALEGHITCGRQACHEAMWRERRNRQGGHHE